MVFQGGYISNTKGLILIREGEPIIPFIKGIYDKPSGITINIEKFNEKSIKRIADIVCKALNRRG